MVARHNACNVYATKNSAVKEVRTKLNGRIDLISFNLEIALIELFIFTGDMQWVHDVADTTRGKSDLTPEDRKDKSPDQSTMAVPSGRGSRLARLGWMATGIAEKAFADAWAALRPGGILGIEEHRLGPEEDQDPAAANGYVQEAFVKQLAAEAGFAFVAASEINANERDTKDHPFGVETLPPMGLTAPRGSPRTSRRGRGADGGRLQAGLR